MGRGGDVRAEAPTATNLMNKSGDSAIARFD